MSQGTTILVFSSLPYDSQNYSCLLPRGCHNNFGTVIIHITCSQDISYIPHYAIIPQLVHSFVNFSWITFVVIIEKTRLLNRRIDLDILVLYHYGSILYI